MLRQLLIQNKEGYTLPYPAWCWEEGMLLGNGSQGADAWGDAEHEKITLTEETLFAPVDEGLTPIEMAERLPEIRKLLKDGKSKEASELVVSMFREKEGLEEKIWTNPFIPAGDLHILTENTEIYENYERKLVFETGEGQVTFQTDKNSFLRKYFLSRADECLVVEICSEEPADYQIYLSRTPYVKNGMHVNKKMFPASGGTQFFKPHIQEQDTGLWYQCGYEGKEKGYGIILEIAQTDGNTEISGKKIHIKDAKKVLFLVRTFAAENAGNENLWKNHQAELQEMTDGNCSVEENYQKLFARHKVIHQERFNRMDLTLENKHLETMFHAGRYEIFSSCGKLPPNLQGVWNGTYDTPWSSDYTQNGNLQTAIMGLLPCGDFEGMESYFGYQEGLLEDYRENSRVLYGCRGIHVPSRTSDCGVDFHFDITWPMVFWTAGAAWVSHFYYDYWLYTGDDEFFKNRALPFMKEAALFYEDYLYEDERGYWEFNPSYSPENTPGNKDNAACINATMDISVAMELFRNLITGCRTLGIEEENVQKWKTFLDKMPPYLMNEEGALKEWATEDLEDRYDHRHSSHLYMLYYDVPDEKPEVLEAAKKAYEIKMKRKKEEQGTMAFGLVQAGMAAAHLGDREMAGVMLKSMSENNYYRTYASSHDYGPSIFNADISGGVPALMLECLVQCSVLTDEEDRICEYEIRLLPAVPDLMKTGEIENVHLRGGFLIDLKWENGMLVSWNLKNPLHRKYHVLGGQNGEK